MLFRSGSDGVTELTVTVAPPTTDRAVTEPHTSVIVACHDPPHAGQPGHRRRTQMIRRRAVTELVEEVAQRRIPIAEAQQTIRDFVPQLEPGEKAKRLSMLARGLFDHMNAERSQVISGIGRYARGQAEIAARLRKEASQLGELQMKPDTDIAKVQDMTDRLNWETRIFEERVQSLTFVCEVPTLIEQRLYALSKTIAEELTRK